MGAYNQGGGGGRAAATDTEDPFAYDQPFQISNTFTPETAQQINDMFAILFKAVSRAQTNINALQTVSSGELLVVERDITEAELEVLGTVPITIIEAQGDGTVIVPIFWALHINISTAYTSSPTLQLRYAGDASNIMTTLATGLATATGRHTHQGSSALVNESGDSGSPRNTAMEISFNADPTGTGSAVMRVAIWYTVTTNWG